ANILKSRPPNNRDPRPEEVRACLPYLFRQIELVNPQLILCVGRIAAQTLLETDTSIGKLRGQLLNTMLKAIGLKREQVFIANILKSRPPNNRDPKPEEVRACLPYLFRQIELVNPQLLLCVGRIAAQTLLETDTPIGKLRGQLHRIAGNRPMIVTYHPAYLLRSPGEKRKSWADLLLALRTFESLGAQT
ncbi:MAG TPA: uracil-DNA glycosylase family protein, partial [Steroidobacteraceae bacterium]|nr:uracil-DNA glycosylase family protein [Steroidobacteraceae bacterium]